jgi:hypothetical protein
MVAGLLAVTWTMTILLLPSIEYNTWQMCDQSHVPAPSTDICLLLHLPAFHAVLLVLACLAGLRRPQCP